MTANNIVDLTEKSSSKDCDDKSKIEAEAELIKVKLQYYFFRKNVEWGVRMNLAAIGAPGNRLTKRVHCQDGVNYQGSSNFKSVTI